MPGMAQAAPLTPALIPKRSSRAKGGNALRANATGGCRRRRALVALSQSGLAIRPLPDLRRLRTRRKTRRENRCPWPMIGVLAQVGTTVSGFREIKPIRPERSIRRIGAVSGIAPAIQVLKGVRMEGV